MKKKLLTLIVFLAFGGSIFAQYESHWPGFYDPDFEDQSPLVAAIVIDGEIVTAENYPDNWNALEIAFFYGDESRGTGFYLYNGYVEDYGDPFPVIDGVPVYFNTADQAITVKMYDHVNNIEYNECSVTYLGEPYTILTGGDHTQGWFDPENPIMLNFTTPAAECGLVLGEVESFETYTTSTELRTGVLPDCWTVAHHYTTVEPDTVAMVYRSFASEGSYSLRLHHRGIVAMPALPADVDINLLKLDMVVRQPQTFYSLQVGVMTSLEDESTFVPVALCNNPTTGKLPFECNFASYVAPEDYEGPFYIAFKNIGIAETDPHSVNYLDEVVVDYLDEEEIPSCAITELTYTEYFNDLLIADDGRLVPECWTLPEEFNSIPTQYKPQLYNSFAHTGSYSLKMRDFCVYAMPKYAVPNTPITDVKMTFWLRQAHKAYQLEVGVMTDANDANTFVPVQLIDNETTGKELVEVSFANYTGPVEGDLYIAFRNKGQTSSWTYSYNYIDDIEIAPINRSASAWNTDELDAMDADSYLDNIVVYPNPTTGNLYIDAMDVQKVECYNQMGQLVGVYDNANELNISDLSNGVYMLRITVPQGMTMRKVVKR